jgi:eukaryotic-like serine/threonine-protein kinase
MPPPADTWSRIKAIVNDALDRPAAEREAFVDDACAGDAALLAEVRSLLAAAAEADADDHLEVSAALQRPPQWVGQRVGAWRLLREIGQGGMGTVFEAERVDGQYRARAAIKLLRHGSDHAAVLARFRNERQILAGLEHPNIARLLDGGAADDGTPWLALELVEGEAIDLHCARRGLPVDQRLALFTQVCEAVQHAHRHGVIHRDIKPANVIVTSDGVPKLLDFGIAKLLGDELAAQTLAQTLDGARLLTPYYASPEQVRGGAVTTATDVYGLGLLLYELLTGQNPHRLRSRLVQEVLRVICEEEPTRPSTLVLTGPVGDGSTAPARALEQARALGRQLSGDLDNIVLTALRKEPAQRYASVERLQADVRAFQAGEPVAARAQTWAYRASKWVRRNRLASAAGVLAVVSLLGGTALATWQAHEARQQRDRAERRFAEVRQLAHALLFDYHDEIQLLPGSTAVRQRLLDDARQHLDSLQRDAGDDDTTLLRELGVAYRRLGELQHAESRPALGQVQASVALIATGTALLERAVALAPGDRAGRYQLGLALTAAARSQVSRGAPAEARDLYSRAAGLFDTLVSEQPTEKDYRIEQIRRQMDLAEIYRGSGNSANLGDGAAAQKHLARALTLVEPLARELPDDTDVLALQSSLQNVRYLEAMNEGRSNDGLAILRSLNPVFERLLTLEPHNTLFARDAAVNQLSQGTALMRLGRWSEALQASSNALQRMQKIAERDPANRVIQRDIAKLDTDVGTSQMHLAQWPAATSHLIAATTSLAALAQRDAADRRVARLRVLSLATLAELHGLREDPAALAPVARQALSLAQAYVASAGADAAAPPLQAATQSQVATAWQSASRRAGDAAAREACVVWAQAHQSWEAIARSGQLLPAQAPRREAARQAADACKA